jgi:hypothetical protein
MVESVNPLYDVFVWTYDKFQANRDLDYDKVKQYILDSPTKYDAWWRGRYREAPQHILIETTLILFILWLIFIRRTVDPSKTEKNAKLSEKEVDELVETWYPEPLVPVLTEKAQVIANNLMVFCFRSS